MRNNKGFTLIELLIVVVIIGILAAIAIPKFSNTKEKAYVAAVKSDIRNLATAEESYFADNQVNTTSLAAANFTPSVAVTVTPASLAVAKSWSAASTHAQTAKTCKIGFGPGTATSGAAEGVVKMHLIANTIGIHGPDREFWPVCFSPWARRK
jgi:type IV pilus assembly protein PilA